MYILRLALLASLASLCLSCGKGKQSPFQDFIPPVIKRMVGNDVTTSPYSASEDKPVGKCNDLNCNFESSCCWQNNQPPNDDLNWEKASGQGEAPKMRISFGTTQQPEGNYLITAAETGSSTPQTAQMYSCPMCSLGSTTVSLRHWQSKGMSIDVCQIHDPSDQPSNCQTLPSTSGQVDSVQLPADVNARVVIIAKGFTAALGSVAIIDDITVDCQLSCVTTPALPLSVSSLAPKLDAVTIPTLASSSSPSSSSSTVASTSSPSSTTSSAASSTSSAASTTSSAASTTSSAASTTSSPASSVASTQAPTSASSLPPLLASSQAPSSTSSQAPSSTSSQAPTSSSSQAPSTASSLAPSSASSPASSQATSGPSSSAPSSSPSPATTAAPTPSPSPSTTTTRAATTTTRAATTTTRAPTTTTRASSSTTTKASTTSAPSGSAATCKAVVCNFEAGDTCSYSIGFPSGSTSEYKNFAVESAVYMNRLTGVPVNGEGSKFCASYLKSLGDKATLITNVNFDVQYMVKFLCYKAVQGVNMKACCGGPSNCPYGASASVSTSDYRAWKPANITCPAGTTQIHFICENVKGESEGACAVDGIELLRSSGQNAC